MYKVVGRQNENIVNLLLDNATWYINYMFAKACDKYIL